MLTLAISMELPRHSFLLVALVLACFGCSSDDGGGSTATGGGGSTATGGGGSTATGGGGSGGTPATGGSAGATATGGSTSTCTECNCLTGAAPTLSADVQPILTQRCATASCHAGAAPKAKLDLQTGQSHAQLVGVATDQCNGSKTRVTASDPAASYLINKLTGQGMCFGTQMPKSTTKLTGAELETIVGWICAGAQND